MSWTLVGRMPEPALQPKLEFYDEGDNRKYILIKPRYRNDMDYYFELDLYTNKCIKKQIQSTKQKEESIPICSDLSITDNKNIMFRHTLDFPSEYVLNVLSEQKEDEWYKCELSNGYDLDFGDKFALIISYQQYIIILCAPFDGKHDILICDIKNLKLYHCDISLPNDGGTLTAMSPIIIPKVNETNLLKVLSYFVRKNCIQEKAKIFPNDIYHIIIKYHLNHDLLYIFGGVIKEGLDGHIGSNSIYMINVDQLLNNKIFDKYIKKTVDNINDIGIWDHHHRDFPICVIGECRSDEPANYMYMPCMHVCGHKQHIEQMSEEGKKTCFFCSNVGNAGYTLMS